MKLINITMLEGEDLQNYQIARAKLIAALVHISSLEYTGDYNAVTQTEILHKINAALVLIDKKVISNQ